MKKLSIFLIFFSILSYGQYDLKFDKKFVQSEDNWVAFPSDSTGSHAFGFIYIDPHAGLTLDYSGSFKIDNTGKLIVKPQKKESLVKYRLQPNNTLVAFIPDQRLNELGVKKKPEWIKHYKGDEESIEFLYKRGFMYNGWNECEKALTYLEKAEKIDSKYKGLQTELSFSYNALKQFDKAEKSLLKAIEYTPNDCYALKELAYTYLNLNKLDNSGEVYLKMKGCSEKNFIQETSFNLAYKYYELKDKENFQKWNLETRNWGTENSHTKNLDILEKRLK